MLKAAGVKVKLLRKDAEYRVRRSFRGDAHERSRGTADHYLSCTEQSGRKKSDTFCSVHILPPRLW